MTDKPKTAQPPASEADVKVGDEFCTPCGRHALGIEPCELSGCPWRKLATLRADGGSKVPELDPLPSWNGKPTAEQIEAHYPDSQHQPDECEMCRFIHDAAKAYVAAAPSPYVNEESK